MKQLIKKLNEASKAYYIEGKEILSDYEYDKLYDKLLEMEKYTEEKRRQEKEEKTKQYKQ